MIRIVQHKQLSILFTLLTTYHLFGFAASQPSFRFEGVGPPTDPPESLASGSATATTTTNNNNSLIWQPLRATFRPLNRQSPPPPPPPTPPPAPTPPTPPPPPPEPLALIGPETETGLGLGTDEAGAPSSSSLFAQPAPNSFVETEASSSTTSSTTTQAPSSLVTSSGLIDNDEEQPTRQPLNRFRPTRPPSVDPQPQPTLPAFPTASGSFNGSHHRQAGFISNSQQNNNLNSPALSYRITSECFECICEASTSCNTNSRCQTSDVRHTRCGMFLISYDQWLDTGLSRELVSREARARDAAADERAFYECVTERECAERLLSIYMQKRVRDCDKDGRVDCYDVAAVHQAGAEQCNGETLLESQYWSDFNACFGFGR